MFPHNNTTEPRDNQALDAYREYCDRSSAIYQEPSSIEWDGKKVTLSNVNGVLAVLKLILGDEIETRFVVDGEFLLDKFSGDEIAAKLADWFTKAVAAREQESREQYLELDRAIRIADFCKPRHHLHTCQRYSLYAYGDVLDADGKYLGPIDGNVFFDEDEYLDEVPEVLERLWGGFCRYWCCPHGELDRWVDGCGSDALFRLDSGTGRWVIEDETETRPGSFTTVGEVLSTIDSSLWASIFG